MKYLKCFAPSRQGLIIGAAVGIATKNIVVGIVIILIFGLVSYIKSTKN